MRGSMAWSQGFIAVDWGTTNRRAYRIDADGALAREMEDAKGILAVAPGGFPAAVAEIRAALGDLPMLMGGMVGSNRGWQEAAYVTCPADLDALAAWLCWPEAGRTAIVPGVAYDEGDAADVMRGEELQILGAVEAGLVPRDGLVCHPGTHNKWIRLEGGRIVSFRTVMTGELFSLLEKHSILSGMMDSEVAPDAYFAAGVARGLEAPVLTAELFSARAQVLLGKAQREGAASYVSGLLIGADLAAGLDSGGAGEILVIGRPDLCRLYAEALRLAGRTTRQLDGEEAFLAGAKQLAGRMM